MDQNGKSMTDIWKKVTSEKVEELIDIDELDPESLELLQPGMRPEAYIESLSSAGKWTDAVAIMARTLPKREAVWWACYCARKTEVAANNKEEAAALKIAEKWAFKPNEEHRRDAFLQAQKCTTPSVGTMSCLAAAFSGGKLELNKEQSVDLDASVFTNIVSGIVIMAACEKKADQMNPMLEKFLKKGKKIACGGRRKPKG
jgi:hypothetical protein